MGSVKDDGSTTTNLLESLNDWTLSIQCKHSVKIAYVDFSKAFDTVSHNKLFMRLTSYGIAGSLLQWLQPFFLSSSAQLVSGVVQGSGIRASDVFDIH